MKGAMPWVSEPPNPDKEVEPWLVDPCACTLAEVEPPFPVWSAAVARGRSCAAEATGWASAGEMLK